MKTVTVNKELLQATLEVNRGAHVEMYREAVEGWRYNLAAAVRAASLALDAGEEPDMGKLNFGYQFPKPESHEEEYERATSMLSWELGETVVLSQEDFRHFVEDDWDWKQGFKFSASQYSVTDD
jgi:hypothetical protein